MGKSLCLFIISIILLLAKAETLTYVKGSAVVIGKVLSNEKCDRKETQVFLVRKEVVNYQIPVPHQGNFQVHLVPGDYKIVAVDLGGCLYEEDLTVKADSLNKLTLKLEHYEASKKKTSWFDSIISNAYAMTMCIHCLQNQYIPGQPNPNFFYPPYRYGYPTPWWGPFGQFSFRQFYSPCLWGYPPYGMYGGGASSYMSADVSGGLTRASRPYYGGCYGQAYPGDGEIVAGKPNVYFHGKKNEKIKIELEYSGNILATTPSLPNEGLNVALTGDGGLKIDEAKYPYFFYDIRTADENLQAKAGSCVEKDNVVKTMVAYLEKSGFNKKEIEDFHSYWSVKLPEVKSVCIYPQGNNELNKMSNLKITPPPSKLTRVVFVLIPDSGDGAKPEGIFSSAPTQEWVPTVKRFPAGAALEVREWGVAFLTIPQKPKVDTTKLNFGVHKL